MRNLGRRRPKPEATPTKALVAASVWHRVGDQATNSMRRHSARGDWQQQCWAAYDGVGELHYAAGFLGRAMSRARVVAAQVIPGEEQPRIIEDGPAAELAARFLGGPSDAPEQMTKLGIYKTVSGECWLLVEDTGDGEKWTAVSESEVTVSGSTQSPRYSIIGEDGRTRMLPDGTLVMRLWTSHPRRNYEPDSPARGALRALRRLEMLDNFTAATMLSRLRSAGFLIMSTDVDLPAADQNLPEGADPFMATLTAAMAAAIRDPESPEALVPLLLRASTAEGADSVRHLSMESPLTRDLEDVEAAAIRRLALALDMPPEMLLGVGSTNHWNAWSIDEATCKLHVEPALAWVCQAGTQGWLRPGLAATGRHDLARDHILWYDASALTQKPDRGPQAIELYDRGELDGQGLRDETGLGDRQAPTGKDLERQLALKVLVQHPELWPIIGPALGLSVPERIQIPAAPAPAAIEQGEQPPVDAPPAEPDPELPPPPAPVTASISTVTAPLTAACEMAVVAALVRAGKFWMSRRRAEKRREQYADVSPVALYLTASLGAELTTAQLLGDVLREPAARLAAAYGGDQACVEAKLYAYTEGLIVEQEPQDTQRLVGDVLACLSAGRHGDG